MATVFLTLVFCMHIPFIHAQNENVTILTQLGSITGIEETNFVVFRGVPYTEVIPINDNRFIESEVKMSPYSNTYDATYFRGICIQVSNPLSPETMSEDCLYINIFSANIVNGSVVGNLLPVMFWIHGGSFTSGSGSLSLYDGSAFMVSKDVVYVSINYRLGSLGFLSLESILNQTNGRTTGSMNGINDIIVALQYVQSYITDFGGDPSRVTIFGESAGGNAICMLLVSSLASDLFNQAIIQSGSCLRTGSKEQGLQNSKTILNNADLTGNLEELKALNASKFLEFPVAPFVDGYVLNDTLFNIYTHNIESLQLNTDKLIIGFVSMDTLYSFPYFVPNAIDKPPTNQNDLKRYLQTYINNNTLIDLILDQYYPINEYPSYVYNDELISNYSMLWFSINADVCYSCPSFNFIQLLQQNIIAHNTYLYNFIGSQYPYYIPHGGELPFVFNNSQTAKEYFGVEWSNDLSYFTTENWKNFAIYGAPNSSLYPSEWIPFGDDGVTMILQNNNGDIATNYDINYRNGVCNVWLDNPDIMTSLCSLSIAIKTDSHNNRFKTWQMVLIISGVIMIALIGGFYTKHKFAKKYETHYSEMELKSAVAKHKSIVRRTYWNSSMTTNKASQYGTITSEPQNNKLY